MELKSKGSGPDEEMLKLNKSIKWPRKLSITEKIKLFTIIIFLMLSSLLGGAVFLFYPMMVIFALAGRSTWRHYTTFWANSWFSMWVFILENLNMVKITLTGDDIPRGEPVMIISNHPSEGDWLYWPAIAVRKGTLGNMRVVVKDMLQYVPCISWAIDSFNWLFLTRNWEVDKRYLEFNCSAYVEDKYPAQMIIYPEGTDFTPAKQARANKYSKDNNLPTYKYLLTPRSKGFSTCLDNLRPGMKAVYDITVAYEDGVKPSVATALCGVFPKRVHMHIRRFPIEEVPKDEDSLANWCYQVFKEKDELLEYFSKHNSFPRNDKYPNQGELGDLPLSVYFWFVFWVAYTIWALWFFFQSFWVFLVQLIPWIYYAINSFYRPFRVWRQIVPPEGWKKKKE